jgi:hypothetical protein
MVTEETSSSSHTLTLSDDDYRRVTELLSSPAPASTATFVHPGGSACAVTPRHAWILDSGSCDHMTGDAGILYGYVSATGTDTVMVVNGSSMAIRGRGEAHLSSSLSLQSVLHVRACLIIFCLFVVLLFLWVALLYFIMTIVLCKRLL